MQVRLAIPDDFGFIAETFERSFREASTHAEGVEPRAVVRLLNNLIDNGWTAIVAETDGLLIGWTVHGSKNQLAWVYVRDMVRGQKVARYLISNAGVNTRAPIVTPFLPNRKVVCPLCRRSDPEIPASPDCNECDGLGRVRPCKWNLIHRPFLCLPR